MTRILQPEILVIGAGPGGAAAAWVLAQVGHDVLMIDRAEFPREKTCGDGLTPRAVKMLRSIGVLPQVEAAGATRIESVRIIGPFEYSVDITLADTQPTDASYALVLSRFQFDDIMRQYAVEAGVEYMGRVRVRQVMRSGDRITSIEADSPVGPLEVRPRYVILAVGANVGFLKRAGFIRRKVQVIRAVRTYYTKVKIPNNRYTFYFDLSLMPGYGWIFPTSNGMANVGAGVFPTFWASKKPTSELFAEFVRRRAKEGCMREAELVGPLKGYPLRVDFPAQRVAGENWAIVGEAAGLVNPVTGEGIDLAIESGLLAAEILHASSYKRWSNLVAYQRMLRWRYAPKFAGLHILREILVTPLFMDYMLWVMNQHRFLKRAVLSIAQGLKPPRNVFHPLFILQFLMPISPRFVVQEMRKLLNGEN